MASPFAIPLQNDIRGLANAYDTLMKQNSKRHFDLGSASAINSKGETVGHDTGILGWLNQGFRAGQQGMADAIKDRVINPINQNGSILTNYMQTTGTADDYLNSNISTLERMFMNTKNKSEVDNAMEKAKNTAVARFTDDLRNSMPGLFKNNSEYDADASAFTRDLYKLMPYFDEADKVSARDAGLATQARFASDKAIPEIVRIAEEGNYSLGNIVNDPTLLEDALRKANYDPSYMENLTFRTNLRKNINDALTAQNMLSTPIGKMGDGSLVSTLANNNLKNRFMDRAVDLYTMALRGEIDPNTAIIQIEDMIKINPELQKALGGSPETYKTYAGDRAFNNWASNQFTDENGKPLSFLNLPNALYNTVTSSMDNFANYSEKLSKAKAMAEYLGLDSTNNKTVKVIDSVLNSFERYKAISSQFKGGDPNVINFGLSVEDLRGRLIEPNQQGVTDALKSMGFSSPENFARLAMFFNNSDRFKGSGSKPSNNLVANTATLYRFYTALPPEEKAKFLGIDTKEKLESYLNSSGAKKILDPLLTLRAGYIRAEDSYNSQKTK